jgi:hypothetical protein
VDGSSGGEGEEDCVVVAQGAVEHPDGVGIGSKRGGQEEAVQAREGGGTALKGEGAGGGVVEAERIHVGGEERGESRLGGGVGGGGGGGDRKPVQGRVWSEVEVPNEEDRGRTGLEGRGKGGVEERVACSYTGGGPIGVGQGERMSTPGEVQ